MIISAMLEELKKLRLQGMSTTRTRSRNTQFAATPVEQGCLSRDADQFAMPLLRLSVATRQDSRRADAHPRGWRAAVSGQ